MSTASYTYVSEISTPECRGVLQSLGPVSASFGILLTYTLGYFTTWKIVAAVSITFGLFTLVSMTFFPESHPYLQKKSRKEESLESLIWFRGEANSAQNEPESNFQEKTEKNKTFKTLYLSPTTIKPFFLLVFLFLLQELSGIYSVLYYAVNFFQDFNMDINEFLSSIIVGIIRFLMSIFGAILIGKFGRKTLCTVSGTGMGVTLLFTVIYLKYYENHANDKRIFPALPLVTVLGNVFFSMIGMLPIPWILVGELFPLEVRSIMSGVVICIAQCFIFICVKIYPDLVALLNFSGTLVTFMIASFVAAIFTKLFLPETKNKTLEEIEDSFRKKNKELFGCDNQAFSELPEVLEIKGCKKVFRQIEV